MRKIKARTLERHYYSWPNAAYISCSERGCVGSVGSGRDTQNRRRRRNGSLVHIISVDGAVSITGVDGVVPITGVDGAVHFAGTRQRVIEGVFGVILLRLESGGQGSPRRIESRTGSGVDGRRSLETIVDDIRILTDVHVHRPRAEGKAN